MIHRIEIRLAEGVADAAGRSIEAQIGELGIDAVSAVRFVRLFFLIGDLSADDAAKVARDLLVDPVIEQYALGDAADGSGVSGPVIEVHLKSGVMDPVAASAERAIADMGLAIQRVATARRYELSGAVTADQCRTIARRLLANPVIEDVYFESHTPPEASTRPYEFRVVEVPIRHLDDAGLMKLSEAGELFLNLIEMKAIQDYYRRIGREPRDVELETIAQTWSEHCIHKTFRSEVRLLDPDGKEVQRVDNLIKSTVFGATRQLARPWCISVFEDNAGIIEFDETHAVCFKVETHNHPSAIEPYGGASTGVGGVIRDPMGTGLGAQPVANTDVFCFGPPDMDPGEVPKGALHPRRVMRGVVAGVRDYGNRMGIPTVNGAVYFDRRYVGNPLVFCGTVGLIPRDKCFKKLAAGDAIVLVGGRTGRDGIHGATFSSGELTHEHETAFSHAVQIGNAITEKKMLDTILQARDMGLYSAITDCGAGGLSSAVGEMGSQLGAEVHLESVPLKYAGLSYAEIWISEAQERMVLAVPQANLEKILKVFADEGVEATVVGRFGTERKTLQLYYQGKSVGELEMDFLHEGLPRPLKEGQLARPRKPSPPPPPRESYNETLRNILAAPNVASKEWIIRQYDHEVQGGSVLKPLVGAGDGPGDAAVIRPLLGSPRALAIACGMNPHLGDLDPYQSALHAVDEALRNCIAVGGNLERTAILDNFCWGNCNKPDRMGSFVQAAFGCRDAAIAYGTPFISGKDSLNNEFQTDSGATITIPSTLLISAISVIDDCTRCVSTDLKEPGNFLFILGRTGGGLGGSHYLLVEGVESGGDVPPVDMATSRRTMLALSSAIAAGLVRSCHDLSEGGLAVAAAEMAIGGNLGVQLNLAAVPTDLRGASAAVGSFGISEAALLFAESAGRFLVEVAPENHDRFLRLVKDCPFGELGRVTDTGRCVIAGSSGAVIDLAVESAAEAWKGTFTYG